MTMVLCVIMVMMNDFAVAAAADVPVVVALVDANGIQSTDVSAMLFVQSFSPLPVPGSAFLASTGVQQSTCENQ